MSCAHDQQGTMMLGNDFVFHHLRIPFVPMCNVRTNIFAVLHLLPINVGIGADHAHLVLAAFVLAPSSKQWSARGVDAGPQDGDERRRPPDRALLLTPEGTSGMSIRDAPALLAEGQ